MEQKTVHHVEFGVLDGLKLVQNFVSQYSFRLVATRANPTCKQWLVSSKAARFLITELSSGGADDDDDGAAAIAEDPYVHSWSFPTENRSRPVRDSLFNIAWRVRDMDRWVNRLSAQNALITKPLQTVSDDHGSVRVCAVKSCVANIVHTLVDDSDYSGCFLPGFRTAESDGCISLGEKDEEEDGEEKEHGSVKPPILEFVDHVAMYIPDGSFDSVVRWYERCLGMKRFLVNREDDEKEGMVVRGPQVVMRMKVLQDATGAGTCSERGPLDTEDTLAAPAMFVIEEVKPGAGANDQTERFLRNHGGPGVFHVALHTSDIVRAVSQLQAQGARFNDVPYTYYTEVGRLKEMVALGVDVDALRKNRIMIDLERNEEEEEEEEEEEVVEGNDHGLDNRSERGNHDSTRQYKYLMQIFTQPLSGDDTFYLELIQRAGATSFGAGNVEALWRSVEAYFTEKEEQERKGSEQHC